MNKRISQSFFWKLLERFGVWGIQFVLQLVLARLLDPDHYGVLTIMVIFTSLANVFIQSGFNTALIQNKDVTEEDYSSVLWVSLAIAVVVYSVIYFCAPLIAAFYNMPGLIAPLRALALMLFPGALNSVQLAKITRDMDFRKVFYSSISGVAISGCIGILLAYMGYGLWALVAQNIVNVLVVCLVMRFTVKLKVRFVCNFKRIKVLFSFGWKLLVSSLLDTLTGDLYNLVVGKKYDSVTLGYYTRGEQFPEFVIDAVNGAVSSVMLPAFSAEQDDKTKMKHLLRNAMSVSAFLTFPMMAGLAAVASPLITLLLTEKWLSCVPYMQICCCYCALYPVHSCNLQAVNAMGRSDIFLKVEIIKKVISIAILTVAVFCFEDPIAIAASGLVESLICWFINAQPNKKLLGYSAWEQMKDLGASFLLTLIMCVIVLHVEALHLSPLITLMLQIPLGVTVYFLLSWIFKPAAYRLLVSQVQESLKKRHSSEI